MVSVFGRKTQAPVRQSDHLAVGWLVERKQQNTQESHGVEWVQVPSAVDVMVTAGHDHSWRLHGTLVTKTLAHSEQLFEGQSLQGRPPDFESVTTLRTSAHWRMKTKRGQQTMQAMIPRWK